MGFDHKSKREIFHIENIPAGPHIFFSDVLGSRDDGSIKNPIVGSWFRIERDPEASPPKYEYDESGVVVEGDITLKDETCRTVALRAGDTFIIHRGSTVAFSSSDYGIAYKCGSRFMAKL